MNKNKKEIPYPAELTFKCIFRNVPYTPESIKNILIEKELKHSLTERSSNGSKFISYTITAEFQTENDLNTICSHIASLEGYMTMF